MKHGDLHAFLLASRIGENPFVSAWGGCVQELERNKDPAWERGCVGGEGHLSWLGEGSEFDAFYGSRLPFPSQGLLEILVWVKALSGRRDLWSPRLGESCFLGALKDLPNFLALGSPCVPFSSVILRMVFRLSGWGAAFILS